MRRAVINGLVVLLRSERINEAARRSLASAIDDAGWRIVAALERLRDIIVHAPEEIGHAGTRLARRIMPCGCDPGCSAGDCVLCSVLPTTRRPCSCHGEGS